jgi:hypothetical protein
VIKPLDFTASPKKGSAAEPAKTTEEEMKSLSEDPRILSLLNDPQVTKAIENKDYASLMSNPKIMAIVQDPELLKRMMNLYKSIPQGSLPDQ